MISARVPIIKCRIAGGGGIRTIAVDISLGVANGAAAVGYLSRAVAAVPGLRPLVRPTCLLMWMNCLWKHRTPENGQFSVK